MTEKVLKVAMTLDELYAGLGEYRYRFDSEAVLQGAIQAALDALGFPYQREVRLDAKSRIDFLVGAIGLEVKVGGGLTPMLRQIHRYLAFPEVEGLLLVTTKSSHKRLVSMLQGKPVRVLHVGGWL